MAGGEGGGGGRGEGGLDFHRFLPQNRGRRWIFVNHSIVPRGALSAVSLWVNADLPRHGHHANFIRLGEHSE